ncbi:uncharacterized protein LOC129005657 [Macrosteles quadrilineatus]|uniref:uncharacterized protein LOC128982600 n=1 Tax=Macrosteles quadrilineatus TaxID=74068 RepID=UPI0023E20059|nr:uncharacterized protein LOC128982600 [Macrosteles quadrilineatus]XP_054257559.1 uncharacterized protein LOC128982636 [Macrosteles quadrilineatus]XP_054258707.1 uncharacterized protein LOC128983436 [Macrosteles quadrilineatus]XP_054259121.1 uncharacterized protein LOC128983893 [Macrosteles quadrilineatus]XP_054263379.1 uncharacterized protein LOC128986847 [Macrosteles quadrilineatus]XP_054265486.1 uncharacterized protein LOC128988327 [Macrosteles quadrilineatus]XP_054265778.1 uncharacterize
MSSSNALTTPSTWDVSIVEGSGLESLEDLYIILKAVFPQPNVQFERRDDQTYRVRLPYCVKLTSLQARFGEYAGAVTIISAAADLTLAQTRRLAELRSKIINSKR